MRRRDQRRRRRRRFARQRRDRVARAVGLRLSMIRHLEAGAAFAAAIGDDHAASTAAAAVRALCHQAAPPAPPPGIAVVSGCRVSRKAWRALRPLLERIADDLRAECPASAEPGRW